MRSKWLAGALLTTAVLVTAGEGTSDRRDRDHRLRLPPAPPPVAGAGTDSQRLGPLPPWPRACEPDRPQRALYVSLASVR